MGMNDYELAVIFFGHVLYGLLGLAGGLACIYASPFDHHGDTLGLFLSYTAHEHKITCL